MESRANARHGKVADGGLEPILAGLIGIDIQGSRSPSMHEQEAAAQGLRLEYRLFDLGADGLSANDFEATVAHVKQTGFAGVNITHPFKQRIIPLLDELSDEAAAIGAVNTVIFHGGRSIGYNTDSSGFAEGLKRQLSGITIDRVVQIGAGGAGAATAMAMIKMGCRDLVVSDPNGNRAADLVRRMPGDVAQLTTELATAVANADGVINATPIGMEGHHGTPIDVALLHPSQWVADVVYFPLETEFLRAAKAVGCRTAHGGDMAVFQAAGAFDLFTGRRADRERMITNF